MRKFLFVAVALAGLTGCQRNSKGSAIEFVITPNAAAQTATVECRVASSGTCHFVFSNGKAAAPVEADVRAGSTSVLPGVGAGAVYCAAVHQPFLESCKPGPVPAKRATVTVESNSTGAVSD